MTTMSNSTDGNTYALDPESGAEMARLIDQDLLVTAAMRGLLPPQSDPQTMSAILDIACGPGGWALEVAYEHPEIEVVGIDISNAMIDYAHMRAQVQGRTNAIFTVMDATRPLDFPDESFNLVNARFLVGFMLPAFWPGLLQECWRILLPGGAIRLTEVEGFGITSSQALERLNALGFEAFRRAGRYFSKDEHYPGIQARLASLVKQAGYQNVQLTPYVLDFSWGSEAHQAWFQNYRVVLKLGQPFLLKLGLATQEELDRLYEQALDEMESPGFCGIFPFLSVYGTKSEER
jgi:ubiquinone/menaquinone biosynthesis C-methylase UbiE